MVATITIESIFATLITETKSEMPDTNKKQYKLPYITTATKDENKDSFIYFIYYCFFQIQEYSSIASISFC